MNPTLKSVIVGIGALALLSLLAFIQIYGIILIFTLSPLAAGYLSARFGRKDIKLSIFVPCIWSIVQLGILLSVLSYIILPFVDLSIGLAEMGLIALLFVFNISFYSMGSVLG